MDKIIEIEKPKFDNRIFNGGQLENGIKFSIVNDPHLTKSFVSVCLNTGSFSDPSGYEGLAHFLEHMLFMGSKKYPDENHYNTRLNELGGESNAYTDVMETVYYFNVYDGGLEEIFDIFSRFFIDPSFDPDSISREINAVNSEHNKNINKDMWRKYQLMLNLTNKDSNVNTFVTGSLNSLQKKDIREQVIKFYKKYYTTDNISISIASSKPIDQLYLIIEKTFGHISKKSEDSNNSNNFTLTKPFITENEGKTFHLKSIANIYEIDWIWEIPCQELFLDSKDFEILETMITNKSDKSIYFHLKNKGFLHGISVEIRYEGIFNICTRLTKEGYSNLGYIEAVLLDGLNKIINGDLKKFADYYKQVNQINFDCINKIDSEDLCNMLAVNHHYRPTQKIYSGILLISEIKSTKEYHDLFTKYLNINNCMKIISAQDYNQNKVVYNILPEYLAEYSQVTNEFGTDSTYKVDDTLCLFQTTNEYLNSEIKLIKDLDKFDVPKLISERQWYGGCSKFGEPIVILLLHFNSNKFFNSPKSYILSNISCSILNFLATVILYKSSELGYSISFVPNSTTSSISIKISGLNNVDNLKKLLCNVNDFIINIDKLFEKVSKTYVNNLIISFKESYQNTEYLNPWEYSTYIIKNQQMSTEYSSKEIIRELELINYDLIKDYLSKILEGVALTTCVYGNIKSTQVSGLFNNFSKLFEKTNYSLAKINQPTNTMISHPNSQEKSNCITLYYPIGKFLPKETNLISLTTNILSQYFFDDLRTSEQLGYLVRMGRTSIRDEQYIIQKIQSEKPIDFVESKIDLFNKKIFEIIESVDFDNFVATLESQLKEPDYSLDEKFMRYYPEISLRQYLFDRNDILLKQLRKLTKNDLVDFIKKFINNDNKNKIIINGNKW